MPAVVLDNPADQDGFRAEDAAASWRSAGSFFYGFRKNERANIDKDELRALQEVAKDLLGLDDEQLDIALQVGEIVEVRDGNEKA